MKSIISKIKFTKNEWNGLEELVNGYEWGYEATKLVVSWANKKAHELLVKSYDNENNKLCEINFIF